MRHLKAGHAVAAAGGDAIEAHADGGQKIPDFLAGMLHVIAHPVDVRVFRPLKQVGKGSLR